MVILARLCVQVAFRSEECSLLVLACHVHVVAVSGEESQETLTYLTGWRREERRMLFL